MVDARSIPYKFCFSFCFNNIVIFQICALIKAKNVTEHILKTERVPYIVDGDLWVGYDNTQSITEKVTL